MRLQSSAPRVPQEERWVELVGSRSRHGIALALFHWRLSESQGDGDRQPAFSILHEVYKNESAPDVRLYMYLLSDDAAALCLAYEREVIE